MTEVDNAYSDLVKEVLTKGTYKENRTGVDTISKFGVDYTIDNSNAFPLLTTKKMDGYRWNSLIHELIWYFSGEEHIRNLREETSIWDAWADDKGRLDTAYGRFWRRYPAPFISHWGEGESWANAHDKSEWVDHNQGGPTFDQIQYVIDNLKENPNSRRHVVTAWHPANAAVSTLPPCHYTFVFNVQNGNELNLHLTQRSGDIALGVPFNIACYALIQRLIAQETGLEVGKFHHSITDAHIYCGKGERGEWWDEKGMGYLEHFEPRVIQDMIEMKAPDDPDSYDHVPGLLEQIQREPKSTPQVYIANKSVDDIEYDDIVLKNYESHEGIKFGVAE